MDTLAREVGDLTPELADMIADHEAAYGELLAHLFFGEVSDWVVEQAKTDSPELDQLLSLLEDWYLRGDDDVRNLIDVSLLENVEDNPAVVKRLGPALRAAANPW